MQIRQLIHGVNNLSAGPTYSVGYLSENLKALGHDVQVISQGSKPGLWQFNVPLKNFSIAGVNKITGIASGYQKYLSENLEKKAIIHGHGVWRSSNLFPFLLNTNNRPIKFFCSPRGMLSRWSMNHKRLRKLPYWILFQKPALKKIDCFHVTAEAELEDIRRLDFRQPALIIPNGINIPNTQKKARSKTALFLSRINPKKGLEILLNAWKNVQEDFPDWKLKIVGPLDSLYAKKIIRLSKNLGLKQIEFSGQLDGLKKQEAYDTSSLFILPTFSENFGIVVAEALASKLPVITTTETPWHELDHRGCGWCIPVELNALEFTLKKSMKLPEHILLEMGEKGHKWMKEKFSWLTIANNMLEGYEKILSGDAFDYMNYA